MEQNFNIGEMKAEAMRKAFGIDIEKGRTGVYEDNAENRRLNRVGQQYGHKKEEEQKGEKTAKKTEQEQKTSAATMESAAQGASDEALKRAAADPKAPEDVKAAAKKELANRSGDSKGEEKRDGLSVKNKVLKDFKKYSSEEMFKHGFDVGDARESYMKEDAEGNYEVITFEQDGTVIHDKVDGESGKESIKGYKSEEEFFKKFTSDSQKGKSKENQAKISQEIADIKKHKEEDKKKAKGLAKLFDDSVSQWGDPVSTKIDGEEVYVAAGDGGSIAWIEKKINGVNHKCYLWMSEDPWGDMDKDAVAEACLSSLKSGNYFYQQPVDNAEDRDRENKHNSW